MRTMRTTAVSQWLKNKGEEKASRLISEHCTENHTETQNIESILYLTLGSKKSKKLFREMECDVITHVRLV